MAYNLVKQTHPGAPAIVGARVVERLSGRLGTNAPPRAGLTGAGVQFDGRFGVVDCPPERIRYAAPPPAASHAWSAR